MKPAIVSFLALLALRLCNAYLYVRITVRNQSPVALRINVGRRIGNGTEASSYCYLLPRDAARGGSVVSQCVLHTDDNGLRWEGGRIERFCPGTGNNGWSHVIQVQGMNPGQNGSDAQHEILYPQCSDETMHACLPGQDLLAVLATHVCPSVHETSFAGIGWPQLNTWAFSGNDDPGMNQQGQCRSIDNKLSQRETKDCGCNPGDLHGPSSTKSSPGSLEGRCSRGGRLHCPFVMAITHQRNILAWL